MKAKPNTAELLEYFQEQFQSIRSSLRSLETLQKNVEILYSTAMTHLATASTNAEDIKMIRRVVCSPEYNARKDGTAFNNDLDRTLNDADRKILAQSLKGHTKRPSARRR